MFKGTGFAVLAASLLSIAWMPSAPAQESGFGSGPEGTLRIGAHGGTLGLGASAGVDLSESFSARGMFNLFDYSHTRTESGNRYKGDLELQSFGMVADWYPFGDGLHLTGGLFLNNNELKGRVDADDLDIGSNEYKGRMDLKVDLGTSLAPYLGIGWSTGRNRSGLGVFFDAGVLFQGSPSLSASGAIINSGTGQCVFSLSEDGEATLGRGCSNLAVRDRSALETDLEAEHRDLDESLEDFNAYPVLALGISYRF